MAGLEKVVRPYQLRQSSPSIKLETVSQVDAQPVVLRIGLGSGGGSGKILTGNYNASATYYQDKKAVEAAFALSGSFL